MTKLWLLLLFSLFWATMITERERRMSCAVGYPITEKLLSAVLMVVLSLFCGLRIWFNDTVTYLQMYDQAPLLPDFFDWSNLKLASGIGFKFVLSLLKTAGFSSQDYLMFFAFATVIPYVWFVHRYCREHFVFGIFLMFTTGFYAFTFAAIKQCMATAICLLSIPLAEKKHWISFTMVILLACLFHPYAIIYLLTPFLNFRPWSGGTYLLLGGTLFLSAVFPQILEFLVDITSEIGAEYSVEELSGEGVNIFRVLVAFVPVGLSFLYQQNLFGHSTRTQNLLVHLSIIHACIMFVGLFGTANYFARLANYFLPAQVAVLPWIISETGKNDRKFLSVMCVLGYLGYFVYENAILKTFDLAFSQIPLMEYVESHFSKK